MTLFGIDRLLADPELREPLAGQRVALLAHPASVTRDLTHSLDALVAAGVNVSAVFGPQHGRARRYPGQYDGDAGLHRSEIRRPGVQPLWRGPPADRPVDGHVRYHPDRPPGPRLPDLHLRHDAALRTRGRGRAWQERLGARPSQSRRPPGRGHDLAAGLGELRRRRADGRCATA